MRERIAILGAGIIGCLVGRELFRAKPDARVTLIERDLVGQGASQRSAGVHFPAGRNERVRAMAAFSEQYYASLLAERFDLPIYRLTLYALASRNAAGTLRRTLVSADEIEDPSSEGGSPISWPPGFTVWRIPGCQYSDVGALVRALARDLRGTTELLEGVIVEEISERGDGVSLSLSTGESVRFDKVVLAPGPWASSPACRALTKSLDIRVKKIVSLHLDLPLHDGSAAVLFL
jgi:glycine/D-amino acid oxidase-like deaminating enzyme